MKFVNRSLGKVGISEKSLNKTEVSYAWRILTIPK